MAGQILAIGGVSAGLSIPLPLMPMGAVILVLVALNLACLLLCRLRRTIPDLWLFGALLVDVAALAVQLYLSGGAVNPFVSLFLLQVILGAVLLPPMLTWSLVAVAAVAVLLLTRFHRPMDLSALGLSPALVQSGFLPLYLAGLFVCFLQTAVLLALFVMRITANLRDRDRSLAELRQRSVEEDYIVRMGLLASGAAHELGTPLNTLSVILNDWQDLPALYDDHDMAAELADMQSALFRCRTIVSRVLMAAGEARGEDAKRTTLSAFVADVVGQWRDSRVPAHLEFQSDIGADEAIVADQVIRQVILNLMDNALEASPDWVSVTAARTGDALTVTVGDKGRGFDPQVLANLGRPYHSTKGRAGSGLGLFLVVNVLRKLNGSLMVRPREGGGSDVTATLPLAVLSIGKGRRDGR